MKDSSRRHSRAVAPPRARIGRSNGPSVITAIARGPKVVTLAALGIAAIGEACSRVTLRALAVAAIVGIAGCAGDNSGGSQPAAPTLPVQAAKQALSVGDTVVITLESTSPKIALATLNAISPFSLSGAREFARIDSKGLPFSTAKSQSERPAAFVEFLRRFGAAFVPSGQPVPAGPIELTLAKAPVRYERGDASGVVVFFRQRFGKFESEQLIGGVFVNNDLVWAAGSLLDPLVCSVAPGSLAVPTEVEARAIFATKAGIKSESLNRVRGVVREGSHRVTWIFGIHVLDAATGDLLPDLEVGVSDPE